MNQGDGEKDHRPTVVIAEKKNISEVGWILIGLVIAAVVIFLAVALRSSTKDHTEYKYDPDGACATCGYKTN